RLSVGNADGECLEPSTVKVLYRKPPPPKAVVEFIEPRTDLTVDTRRCPLAFRVISASPLRRVEVTVNDRKLDGLARTEEDGGIVYRTDVVPLEPGPNVLQVVAVNDGGASVPARRTVSYTRRTAVVRLDRLQRQDTRQFLDPGATAPVGNVWLHGRVE